LSLTYPQYLVMLVLWESSPQCVGDLAARLQLDSGTLTPLLKRLEGAGLVSRRRDSNDERRVLVALTDAGLALKRRAREVPMALGARLNLPREDVEALRGMLQNMIAVLLSQLEPAGQRARLERGVPSPTPNALV
jgi:DNA-binding MarR family transcriptional regulator